jgi:hypothetical protein
MKPLFIGLITGAAAALPLLTPSPAHAISCAATSGLSATGTCTIEDAGNTYEISIVTDTFANAFPAPSTDNMFWWGDEGKSADAALAVGAAFGYPNVFGYPSFLDGPLFAVDLVVNPGSSTFVRGRSCQGVPELNCSPESGFPFGYSFSLAVDQRVGLVQGVADFTWARSSLVSSAAVPGPLPVIGAAAAFGFSRKLRKRIMQSRSIVRAQAVA